MRASLDARVFIDILFVRKRESERMVLHVYAYMYVYAYSGPYIYSRI